MSKKNETKKLNRLAVKKETIADLNVQDAEQIKGGTIVSARPTECKTKPTIIAPPPTRDTTRNCIGN